MIGNTISDSIYISNKAALRTVSPSSIVISTSRTKAKNQASSLINTGEEAKQNKFLFEKKLSQSDVDDMNRLFLPTRSAEIKFPCQEIGQGKYKKETLLFVDHHNISWEMTYEAWESSKSFVLSKGWIEFVNHYQLRPNFVVRFYQLDPRNMDKKHYDIRYAFPKRVKTIRLFGQTYNYLCWDETNNGGGSGNGGGGGDSGNGDGGAKSNGQNKAVERLAKMKIGKGH
ncbi:hypothetical protein NE237_029676 [Protea cynaroides]|uniref:TF-B3 domain-containing protein n=1 Tax=Protea cynaroides TaxID=273540 RepID=A0A9Q0GSL9_9MAGN|nr:hypothetical protein NE237_029676 [Protea cynaroides]